MELISSKEPLYNMDIDVNKAASKLLDNVREASHLQKLIQGFKKVLIEHDLVGALTPQYQKMLGLSDYQQRRMDEIAMQEFDAENE